MVRLILDLRNSGGAPSCGPECAEPLGATRMSLMHQVAGIVKCRNKHLGYRH